MCLITTRKKPFIAKEDMIVYKAFSRRSMSYENMFFTSIHFPKTYEVGRIYNTTMKIIDSEMTYDSVTVTERQELIDNGKKVYAIGPGFHAAELKSRIFSERQRFICECIIPKGSKYYIDNTGLIVSNSIIVSKLLREPIL